MLTRDGFVQNLKTRLDALNSEINIIEKKAQTVKEESKTRLQRRITYFRQKCDAVLTKLQIIKNTDEDAWLNIMYGPEQQGPNMTLFSLQ